jgi:hypothetical protein
MDKNYIGVNFPNLISVTIMVGVIVALFFGIRKFAVKKAEAASD